jgi:glycosyltransferase involved in cell wall biosynthesis
VEFVMAAQARKLREAGYDVRLIAGKGEADLVPELDSRHPEVSDVTRRLQAGKNALRQFKALRDRIRNRLRPLLVDRDLVIAHNVMTMPFNLPLAAALSELGVPVIAWTHDIAWSNGQYDTFKRLDEWPYSIMGRPQEGITYVAISRVRQRELARVFGQPISEIPVVPNGIDPHEFVSLGPRVQKLLEGARAQDADPLRDQEQRARLRLDEVVCFLFEQRWRGAEHSVRSQDVADLYRISDVVLMLSGAEGFGLPVLEAAVARVPLVCADIPILREVGGDELYTFPAGGDGADVAAAVRRALESSTVRQRRFVLRRYAWHCVLASTERIIASVLDSADALESPVAIAQ